METNSSYDVTYHCFPLTYSPKSVEEGIITEIIVTDMEHEQVLLGFSRS